jgi:hypothetical protein
MSKISAKPPKLDLEVVRGDSFGPVICRIKNPDGTPMDLTGCSFLGQVRHTFADTTVLATFTMTVTDAPGGEYSFELDVAATTALPAPTPADPIAGRHVYDHQMTDSLGRVTTRRFGALIVIGDVTRV